MEQPLVETEQIRPILFQMLCVLAAFNDDRHPLPRDHNSEAIREDGKAADRLIEDYARFILNSNLLLSAVSLRHLDDRQDRRLLNGEISFAVFVEDGEVRGLTLREACNKIIHSDRFWFEAETSRGDQIAGQQSALRLGNRVTAIVLEGSRFRSDTPIEWAVDINDPIRLICAMIRACEAADRR